MSTLEQEAAYIHERFFGGPPPAEVAGRYAAAHRRYGIAPDRRMDIILDRRLDIEAIELALRIGRRDRSLTAKIQVLFYLVEVRSAYYHRFVNTETRRARAWWAILAAVPATVWKYAKGAWLVRRYGL
ncbi:MAG TPA: hypothetical protein VHA11_06420 [Bryobacteraceae bacterium]|nr:hypothetical protein [Bryobacteraceae bacterium]